MNKQDSATQAPIEARVVHKSAVVERDDEALVYKLMLNLVPQGLEFEPGMEIEVAAGADASAPRRRYAVEMVGAVPFEASVDITIYISRQLGSEGGAAQYLLGLEPGESLMIHGPYPDPFYPPMGSRSSMILIGAGSGMVPFRWLARKIQTRGLDWMGKVLMLEGGETGVENLYLNRPLVDEPQYFDEASRRAFESLKTRYSAVASDVGPSAPANRDAMWRLMGQGRVYVYLAGYRGVADALDIAMEDHLRLPGRWAEAKAALKRNGHWLEFLYD